MGTWRWPSSVGAADTAASPCGVPSTLRAERETLYSFETTTRPVVRSKQHLCYRPRSGLRAGALSQRRGGQAVGGKDKLTKCLRSPQGWGWRCLCSTNAHE